MEKTSSIDVSQGRRLISVEVMALVTLVCHHAHFKEEAILILTHPSARADEFRQELVSYLESVVSSVGLRYSLRGSECTRVIICRVRPRARQAA